jgi:hypothetical protein
LSDDPEIARLSPDVRKRVGDIWADRARTELGAGSGFAQVVVSLYALGARPEVLELATRAAHEEVAHARSCHRLAELYLGEAIAMPRPKKVGMPEHAGANDPLRRTLHVIGLSCINETIAAEFVARCLDASEAHAVREASSVHLRDEIGHARVGWAHLASDVLDANDRRAVAAWLPRLVRANARAWMDRIATLPEEGIAGHGYPPAAHLRAGVRHAFDTVIAPGFDEVRIATAGVRDAVAELA